MSMDTNGKVKVIKHGTKEITREGFEYELTVNFELMNEEHLAKASKDRTGLFVNKPEFVINTAIGRKLREFANSPNNKLIEEKISSQGIQIASEISLPLMPTLK